MVLGLKNVLGLRGHRILGKNETQTAKNMSKELRDLLLIDHVLNEKGTGYECLKLIGGEKWILPYERASNAYSDYEIWARNESLEWIGGTTIQSSNHTKLF